MITAKWLTIPVCLIAVAIGIGHSAEPPASPDEASAVRPALIAVNDMLSRARVTYDRDVFERLLAPDFHVTLAAQRVERADFIAHISAPSSPGRLVRFDNQVMTITHQPDRNEWIAVVVGKMEWEQARSGESASRVYGMWTTREGYRRVDSTRWQITFTEEIGSEYWSDGQKPPFPQW